MQVFLIIYALPDYPASILHYRLSAASVRQALLIFSHNNPMAVGVTCQLANADSHSPSLILN
ncbi:MAG: hypothetical protein KDA84_23390 [Planctomycetaceae bacterium]|nr:hypothetical protein [Planctomycetaceae bacterium]